MSDVEPESPELPPEDQPSVEESTEPDMFTQFLGDVNAGVYGDIPTEDLPPLSQEEESVFGDITSPVGDGECIVCGAPTFRPPGLTKAGNRRRAPRYCDIHARNRKVQNDGPILAGVESQLQRIQEELADDIRLLGVLAGPLLPVTGYYVTEHADPFTIAVLKLAKNNQRILRVLHRAASVAPIYTVAECVAGTAYAIQVDQRKVDPHNNVARRLGVTRAYESVYPQEAEYNITSNGFTGPPRYSGVQ